MVSAPVDSLDRFGAMCLGLEAMKGHDKWLGEFMVSVWKDAKKEKVDVLVVSISFSVIHTYHIIYIDVVSF